MTVLTRDFLFHSLARTWMKQKTLQVGEGGIFLQSTSYSQGPHVGLA